MNQLIGRLSTPIPKQMMTLAKDPRGYPIPWIVVIDKSGRPQFTINDNAKTEACHSKHLCAICGKRLDKLMWFVGGSRCFLHEHGAFIDPPAHHDCAAYALRVCPFLAMPNYAKRIDDKLLKPQHRPDGIALVSADFMEPSQPERFGFGCTDAYQMIRRPGQQPVLVVKRWRYVEWWRNGEPVNAPAVAPNDGAWVHGRRL